jgi:type VI secretion system protein VasD
MSERSALCGVVGGLLLAACATTSAPAAAPAAARESCRVPSDVQLEIEAADRVNPDETGRSLPTRLRLYQLSDLHRLQRASFEDIWSRPKEALGETALSSEEIVVYPGQVMVHRFKRDEQAEYLVGVAIFREPEGDAWRTAQEWPLSGDPCLRPGAAPLPKLDKLRLRMFLEGNRLDSLNNYGELPKRRCRGEAADCGASPNPASDLRRNRRLRSFEEDGREPELRQIPQ